MCVLTACVCVDSVCVCVFPPVCRLRLGDAGGGGLAGQVRHTRRDQAWPQPALSPGDAADATGPGSLPHVCVRPGLAPGADAVGRAGPRLHRADAGVRGDRHGDDP